MLACVVLYAFCCSDSEPLMHSSQNNHHILVSQNSLSASLERRGVGGFFSDGMAGGGTRLCGGALCALGTW